MASKRMSVVHRAEVLRRERELAAELFRDHSDEEKREIARALDRCAPSLSPRHLEQALPHPQVALPLEVAR